MDNLGARYLHQIKAYQLKKDEYDHISRKYKSWRKKLNLLQKKRFELSREKAEFEAAEAELQARVDALAEASKEIAPDEQSIALSFEAVHRSTETSASVELWRRRYEALSSLYTELKPTNERESK
jgi:hypothetical protein